jgi:hypothetical protein
VNRYAQIARLCDYRDRGIFPLNEGQATQPAPIFVDRHDTACAVGYLMRLSGWRNEVQQIHDANNLVYLSDAAAGPIDDWIQTSGITREEAALIQPGYPNYSPPPPINPTGFVDDTSSFVFGDLRYSNFQVTRLGGTTEAPQPNIDITQYSCGLLGCSALLYYGHSVADQAATDDSGHVAIQFDVEVISPNLRIASVSAITLLNWLAPVQERNDLALYLDSNQDKVFLDYSAPEADENTHRLGALGGFGTILLGAVPLVKNMQIVTEMAAPANGKTYAQLVKFGVVSIPEPSSIALFMTGVALIGTARPRSGAKTSSQ